MKRICANTWVGIELRRDQSPHSDPERLCLKSGPRLVWQTAPRWRRIDAAQVLAQGVLLLPAPYG